MSPAVEIEKECEDQQEPGPIGGGTTAACAGHDHNNADINATAANITTSVAPAAAHTSHAADQKAADGQKEDAPYPLDESPAKVAPSLSVAFAATEPQVLRTPLDGKKSTSNHRAYNAVTNPVGNTVGSALHNAGAGGGGGKNRRHAPPLAAAPLAAPPSAAPAMAMATPRKATAAAASKNDHDSGKNSTLPASPAAAPVVTPPATAAAAAAAAASTPESSPQTNRRLFQAVQSGTSLSVSADTTSLEAEIERSDNDGDENDDNGNGNGNDDDNDGDDDNAYDEELGCSLDLDGDGHLNNISGITHGTVPNAAAAGDVNGNVANVADDINNDAPDTEAPSAGMNINTGVYPKASLTTPPKHPASTTSRTGTTTAAAAYTTAAIAVNYKDDVHHLHHPADESPVKALFSCGRPFQSSSSKRSTPPSAKGRSMASKISPARMHFASTAIPSPMKDGGGDGGNMEENSVVNGGGSGTINGNGGGGMNTNLQGANTFVEDDDVDDADADDGVNSIVATDVSAEVDALDLAGISPIFVRAFGSCGAGGSGGGVGGGGVGCGGVSSRWKKRQQQKAASMAKVGTNNDVAAATAASTTTAATNTGTNEETDNNHTIANLREEIDCLKAKVKARDVGIVKLNGELAEATADLRRVRLMLQKEQRRNNAAFGGGSADGDDDDNAEEQTAAEVASFKRQIKKQEEEIRNRDVRLNWMTEKMESLEVERRSLLEQLAGGGDNTASGNGKEDVLNQSVSSQPGRIGKADDTVALRLKLHESDSTIAALKAEIKTMRSPELQAAVVERLVQKAKRDATTIAALKSENTRLVMEAADGGGDMRQEDTDGAKEGNNPNQSLDEILCEVSRVVDPGAVRGDGPEDEFFGDSSMEMEDPTIRTMSSPPADKAKIKSLEKKLTAEQNEATASDQQKALIARMEKDIDDRDKSLEVLRSIIDKQKKEIKTQRENAERWKEEELALEEENKELKRTLKKAAKVAKEVENKLDATADVTMETDTSQDATQDIPSMVAFSVNKISQWVEKMPQCVPDDPQAVFGK